MTRLIHRLIAAGFVASLMLFAVAAVDPMPAAASEIKYVVNNAAITSYDIQKRLAFLKLQHKPGASAKMAGDEMVEQALKAQEIEKRKANIPQAQVDASFAKFAAGNKMTTKQLSDVLDRPA